jgi:hypothetical protein
VWTIVRTARHRRRLRSAGGEHPASVGVGLVHSTDLGLMSVLFSPSLIFAVDKICAPARAQK